MPGDAPRFAVLGNCQAAGFLDCLRAFLPGAEGELFDLTTLGPPPGSVAKAEAIASRLGGFAHVFAHPLHGERFGPLDARRLGAAGLRLTFVPVIAFEGFHPDCVYLWSGTRRLKGPMDEYHSAIVAGAFTLGLPPARVERLFNRLVMGRLGYLDAHLEARRHLARHFAELGHDVLPRIELWLRAGAFMHSINHPTLLPIADACRMALARAGFGEHPLEAAAGVPDRLAAGPAWPVYPPVAEALGIPGSTAFRPAGRDAAPMTLGDFVAASYDAYAREAEAVEEGVARDAVARRVREALRGMVGAAP